MDDFLYFLIAVGIPVTGATIVLTSYIIIRYKKRRFLIESSKEVHKDSSIFPFSRIAILQEVI